MPEGPNKPDSTVVFSSDYKGWVRCSCGQLLLWVEFSRSSCIIAYCRKCKKTWRVLLGADLDIDI